MFNLIPQYKRYENKAEVELSFGRLNKLYFLFPEIFPDIYTQTVLHNVALHHLQPHIK